MAEKQCPSCKMMINKDAKVCPHCRKKFGLGWPEKISLVLILGLVGYLISLSGDTSYTPTEDSIDETPKQTQETIDTSGYFIKGLLNSSPKEVAKVLGDPDGKIKASKDCDYLPSCNETTYQNGKYEVLYYKNKLKWITINQKGLFNKNAIRYAGFQSCEPTFSDPLVGYDWRNSETRGTATGPLIPIKGLRQVCAFPDYILITVETDYDKKF